MLQSQKSGWALITVAQSSGLHKSSTVFCISNELKQSNSSYTYNEVKMTSNVNTSASISVKYLKNHHQTKERFQSTVSLGAYQQLDALFMNYPGSATGHGGPMGWAEHESAVLPFGGTA